MITDLANEIAMIDDLRADDVSPDIPPPEAPIEMDHGIRFGMARPMSVAIPTTVTSRADCFIDDIINVFLDTTRNRAREPHKVPLAVYVSARPHAGSNEPITRKPNLAPNKLAAEGTPAETQIVLGWTLDTRRLLVSLPSDKFQAWMKDVEAVIKTKTITEGELESLLGRLNHAAYVIPLARHFLGRLRRRLKRRKWMKQQITLTSGETEDLVLWRDSFLPLAHTGVSMNLITHRRPDNIGWSDTCPFGGGGFDQSGFAWRFRIPPASPLYGCDIANNFLEFLGMAVNLYLMVLSATDTHQCFLILGDNTSGLGWMVRSGRLTPKSKYFHVVTFIARKVATLLLTSGHCLARQHVKGEMNVIPDLLSYTGQQRVVENKDIHPLAVDSTTNDELTHSIHTYLPQLIPEHFEIQQLPEEVCSFVVQALQIAESTVTPKLNQRSKIKTELGEGGAASAGRSESAITPSSITFHQENKNSSCEDSSPPYADVPGLSQETLLEHVQNRWLEKLSEAPQATWLRRFGAVSNGVPYTSRTAPTYDPHSDSFYEPSTTLIRP